MAIIHGKWERGRRALCGQLSGDACYFQHRAILSLPLIVGFVGQGIHVKERAQHQGPQQADDGSRVDCPLLQRQTQHLELG